MEGLSVITFTLIFILLLLLLLLYGSSRLFVMSAEIKFMSRTTKYTWQDYKTFEDTRILSEHKINPVVKKIQSYRNTSR